MSDHDLQLWESIVELAKAVWHRRHDDDPLQRWLRDPLASILDN